MNQIDFAMHGTERGVFQMDARNWLLAVVASVLCLPAQPAASAADPSSNGPGKPYLVAVGVGEFKDKAIHARPTADADAKALHKLLADTKVLGIAPDRRNSSPPPMPPRKASSRRSRPPSTPPARTTSSSSLSSAAVRRSPTSPASSPRSRSSRTARRPPSPPPTSNRPSRSSRARSSCS